MPNLFAMTLLGYGDALITLSLLARMGGRSSRAVQVVGSGISRQVAELVPGAPAHCTVLTDGVASFYALRADGPRAAVADLLRVRRWLRANAGDGDTVVFENDDWRNRLLLPGNVDSVAVPRVGSAYVDRAEVWGRMLGVQYRFESTVGLSAPPRHIVIAPGARSRDRRLTEQTIRVLLDEAGKMGAAVTLLDSDETCASFRREVSAYWARPSLEQTSRCLQSCDAYVGPDSFLLHLAYFYGKALVGFFHRSNLYFSPPGLGERGGMLFFDDALEPGILASQFRRALAAG